jgi:hypothetical protein
MSPCRYPRSALCVGRRISDPPQVRPTFKWPGTSVAHELSRFSAPSAVILFLPFAIYRVIHSDNYFRRCNARRSHVGISLLHGAWPFPRVFQFCRHSRSSQNCMEPERSLLGSQKPSTDPYPEWDQSSQYHTILLF